MLPFDDEFLFDQDLMEEGLLSVEDAWQMYQRGEISYERYTQYLDLKRKQSEQEPDKWASLITLIVVLYILISCLSISFW
jgi:hypothetical protein